MPRRSDTRLSAQANAACDALELMRSTDPLDCSDDWVRALNTLNHARTSFQVIDEQMHDELNTLHELFLAAQRGERRTIIERYEYVLE